MVEERSPDATVSSDSAGKQGVETDPLTRALRRLTGPLALIVHQLEGKVDAGIVWDLGVICDRLVELAGDIDGHIGSAGEARVKVGAVLEAFDDATVGEIRRTLVMAHRALADAELQELSGGRDAA